MRLMMIVMAALMVGCASKPKVDADCDHVSRFARGIAILHDTGIKKQDVDQFVTVPTVSTFPVHKIKSQVYELRAKYPKQTPADTYATYYSRCTALGFPQYMRMMLKPEWNQPAGNILVGSNRTSRF